MGVVELQRATARRDADVGRIIENISGIHTGHELGLRAQFIVGKAVDSVYSHQRLVVYGVLNRVPVGDAAAGEIIPGAQCRLRVEDSESAAQHQRSCGIAEPVGEARAWREDP